MMPAPDNRSLDRVRRYLTQSRRLEPSLIEPLIQAGRLYADSRGNPCAYRAPHKRKNWLFCGSDRGGRAAAIHFSFLTSCKRHDLDPWVYYRDILIRLLAMLPGASEEELVSLLPHRWRPT